MIGVDIVYNQRIRKAVERFGDRFLRRIYTPLELEYCKRQADWIACLSARWAGKEAVLKAVYQSKGIVLKFSEIEILGDFGKPAKVRLLREELKNLHVLISLSHEKEYSVAVAVIIDSKGGFL
ncbi:holo-ACP synthase [Thermocrinis sp.]|jgi:holo-[acyl-carrier protein] synthase|uniref:holo-ACP synthase n=2 Tax=Thermocrinis sp. TaxID=2024383 RepID=UPI0026193D50|nr:holo-ACP synthase [Thermocrinis sp.]